MSKSDPFDIRRRRVPRRDFIRQVGVLANGHFVLCQAYQIGEGGMLISFPENLSVDQKVVVSFKLPNYVPDVVRATVRYVLDNNGQDLNRYGLEFMNLDFMVRREIRNYVASQVEQASGAQSDDFGQNQSPVVNSRRIRI